ncbi:MAG: hypothetical protein U0835_25705 [Isosphaeraceae bacterium]
MSIRTVLAAATKVVGTLGVSCVLLGHVAEHSGPRECEAVIHVTETDVTVFVDDAPYRSETWSDTPLSLLLEPGRHTLRMSRQGRTLSEETFTLRPGQHAVLTAWDQTRRPTPYRAGRGPSDAE